MTEPAIPQTERLCALDQVPDHGVLGMEVAVEGAVEALLLLRRGPEVRAFFNVCPHAGRRLDWAPGRYIVSEGSVICAAHGAIFRIPDGQCTAGPCRGQSLREVPVVVRDGGVFLPSAAAPELRTPG